MKRALIWTLAVAALAFTACNKEISDEKVENNVITHIAQVTISKGVDTKTALIEGENEASYVWTQGDAAYLHVYENDVEGEITAMNLSEGNAVATLTVAFTGAASSTYSYKAVYAKELTATDKNPKIQDTQYPKADSFDPAADVMISKATTDVTNVSERLSSIAFTMGRVVTVNKMILTGLNKGEAVSKVELELGKGIVGGSYVLETGNHASTGKKVILQYSTPIVTSDGTFPVYFIAAPVDQADLVSVVVATDQNVYTKSNQLEPNPFDGKSISFAIGVMTRFTMAMGDYGTPVSTAVDYTLVSSADGLPAEGKQANIIIVNGVKAMAEDKGNNRGAATVPDADNNVISIDNTCTAHVFTLAHTSEGYLISDNADNAYLYAAGTSSNNYLKSKDEVDDACYWRITYSEGVATVQSVNNDKTPYMRYNSSSSLFACYKTNNGTNQNPVSLYLDGDSVTDIPVRQDVTLSFDPSNPADINLGDNFTEPTLTKSPSEAPVTYSVATNPNGIASIDSATGELAITGAGVITVTATVSDLIHYNAASASYTLTVIDPNVVDYVTLDWTYPTEGNDATSAGIQAVAGVTASGLGTDYGTDHSPYRIKFDNTGDYIQVKTDVAIAEVSVKYKMVGGNSTSKLYIQESSTGENWNDVEPLTISGSQNSTGELTTTNAFSSASRFVRISFTKGSNVGIGGISIKKVDTTPRFTVASPLEATAAADDYTVNITRKYFEGAITVTVPQDCNWIEADNVAADANSFNVSISANTGSARTATLTLSADGVTSQELVVNQAGAEPGSEANPYTVSQALTAINGLADNGMTAIVYVSGIISSVDSYDASHKSITYFISADGTTSNQLEVYSGKGVNGADFVDIADLAIGDEVVVKGNLKKFVQGENVIPEFNYNSEIVTFTPTSRYTVSLLSVSHGTIAASKTSVGAKSVVTLTATPATGYEFNEWTVTNLSSNQTISVSEDNKFIMPAANVSVSATFTESQGGTPIELIFDLTSNPGGWPTANSTTLTNYTYTLDEVDYTFGLKNVKQNTGYLMCTLPAVIGLPAIAGYKLTKIVANNSSQCSTSTKVGISSSASSESYISGGAVQTWSTQSSAYTYNLSGTAANTVYYLYITNKNAQITGLTLTYTPTN